MRKSKFRLAEIADLVDGDLVGDPEKEISGIEGLTRATKSHLSFLHNPKYRPLLHTTNAAAVLVPNGVACEIDHVICENPHEAYAKVLHLFYPEIWPDSYISPQSSIANSATIADNVHIEAFAWIGERVSIGDGTWIQSGVRVGDGAIIGQKCKVMANSVIGEGCTLGNEVWINPGAVIGGEGFGFVIGGDDIIKVPQVGTVEIEEQVEVGSNSCIDRATLGTTRVSKQSKLDNFVQIGHGATVGEKTLMVAYSALAGSAKVGKKVIMAGRSSVLGHVSLGDDSKVGVLGVVTKDKVGTLSGFPAEPHSNWMRSTIVLRRLPELLRRVSKLENWRNSPDEIDPKED
jgi:UDP-3-O-[3-hydroxymyristoyl] glucosamine N-acyltransferase